MQSRQIHLHNFFWRLGFVAKEVFPVAKYNGLWIQKIHDRSPLAIRLAQSMGRRATVTGASLKSDFEKTPPDSPCSRFEYTPVQRCRHLASTNPLKASVAFLMPRTGWGLVRSAVSERRKMKALCIGPMLEDGTHAQAAICQQNRLPRCCGVATRSFITAHERGKFRGAKVCLSVALPTMVALGWSLSAM